jgi:hypothetical protein
MAVIKKLGDRVEKEHNQFLRDSQRLEDRSATAVNGAVDGLTTRGVWTSRLLLVEQGLLPSKLIPN